MRIAGLVNARDLGGPSRHDGTRTPSGVFFRSENVDRISAGGWDDVAAAGIRTVVDLRQSWERQRDRTPRPDWLTTIDVDLDGFENQTFWKDYWDNGLVGTALYYLAHLTAMPERAAAALVAIVSAPAGGVLFHCMGGRDRTGLISALLLVAAQTEPEDIIDDYLDTVRLGDVRAASAHRNHNESELDELCRAHRSTTERAMRTVVERLNLASVLDAGGVNATHQSALFTWRATITAPGPKEHQTSPH